MSTTDAIAFKYEPKQELTLTAGRCMCLITPCSGLNHSRCINRPKAHEENVHVNKNCQKLALKGNSQRHHDANRWFHLQNVSHGGLS